MTKPMKVIELSLNEITVTNRARKDFGDLTTLKRSIEDQGQLQPILVDEEYKLLAGGRRFQAHSELNKPTISCIVVPIQSSDDAMMIELFENVARKDFYWHEELLLMLKIHKHWTNEAAESGEVWGYRQTAQRLKISLGGLSSNLVLAEALLVFPQLKELKSKGKARVAYKELQERAASIQSIKDMPEDQKARLEAMASGHIPDEHKESSSPKPLVSARHADTPPDFSALTTDGSKNEQSLADEIPLSNLSPEDLEDAQQEDCIGAPPPKVIYVIKPFEEFLPDVPDNSVGFCELDPPYAIDFDKNYGQVSNNESSESDWTVAQLYKFYTDVLPKLYNKLLDNSWILCWTGKEHIKKTNEIAEYAGFKTQEPGFWIKPGGSCNSPKTNMISNTEAFLLFRKGNATFNVNSMLSTFTYNPVPGSQRIHQWEKPREMYQYIFTVFGRPGSIFLSPFAGSGNSMITSLNFDMLPMGTDIQQKHMYSFYKRLNDLYL